MTRNSYSFRRLPRRMNGSPFRRLKGNCRTECVVDCAKLSCVGIIALWAILGCSGKTSADLCLVDNLGRGGSGLSGTSSAAGGSSACKVGTGGTDFSCSNLQSRYSNCTATRLQSDVRNVNMLLVIDKSSSMSEPHPSGNGLSKWDTMRSALGTMFTRIEGPNLDANPAISLGLELFPNAAGSALDASVTVEGCQIPAGGSAINVPILAGAAQLSNVFDVISSRSPGGYTPTAEALRRAYDYYTQGDGRCQWGSRWVMLVSNGEANCNFSLSCNASSCTNAARANCSDPSNCCSNARYLCDDRDAVLAAINDLKNSGIQTYVVGMPSSDSEKASLNAFAIAGGAPNPIGAPGEAYYSIPDAYGIQDLEIAFSEILTTSIKTCDFKLQQTPAHPENTHVFLNCMPVYPTSANADAGSGWYIDFSQSPAHLVLEGDACSALVSGNVPTKAMDIFTDCPSN
jgi:hypothetical protein